MSHRRSAMARLGGGTVVLSLVMVLGAPPVASAAGLTYLVHEPTERASHPPLIVLLHGSGADERDMIGLWHDLPGAFVVVSPRAPFAEAGGGYRWYRGARRAADMAVGRSAVGDLVDDVVRRFDADPKAIFLGGFSQGAVMVYSVALRAPGRYRGAAVLSGSLFGDEASAATDRTTSFFVAHGTADDRIPFAAATAARGALARLGVPAAFHAYPGMGHTIGPAETEDLAAWLTQRLATKEAPR